MASVTKRSVLPLTLAVLIAPAALVPRAQQTQQPQQARTPAASIASSGLALLVPTAHPVVPSDPSRLWLAPSRSPASVGHATAAPVAAAARLAAGGEYTRALSLVTQPAAQQGTLAQYSAYYAAVSNQRLNRIPDALRGFRAVLDQKPVGYLAESAAIGEAEALEAGGDPAAAVRVYERLLKGRLVNVERVYLQLGAAAQAANDPSRAAEALAQVLYEFPLGENAPAARAQLDQLGALAPLAHGSPVYKAELGRAERLFGAKRYIEARAVFDDLAAVARGDDRELMKLRLAECDYFLKRTRAARESLRPLTETAARRGEALFFYGLASRDAGDKQAFVDAMRRIASEFPEQTWAEDALNNLGTYLILADRDEEADAMFRQLYERYPRGNYAERAAWKAGWTAFRRADYPYAARVFEQAASDFPRSDSRPPWLYWAGRAHDELGAKATAQERYLLTAADYMNSYYGRLAAKRLDGAVAARLASRTLVDAAVAEPALPANAAVIRALLDADMIADALNELRYAQVMWGDSSAVQATVAWARQQEAREETGMRRLQLVRAGMNSMRRAYPQFMAAGGESLPRDVQTVIFPLAYWSTIRKHSEANGLDPYFVAALVAQESTFVADVRSAANAYGLMQLLPSTARMYARKLNMPYSTRLLTNPDANVRMGTAYLADKIREFGDLHLVLASYNAGERAVRRWQSERPGVPVDEFIDDIPYPETQNYVKKILGTAEDYRRLYGDVPRDASLDTLAVPATPASQAPPSSVAAPKPAPSAPARKASPPKKKTPPKKATSPRKPAPKKPA